MPLDPRFCRSPALDAELSALSHGNNEAYSNFPSVPGCPLAIQDLSPVESKPSVPPPGEDRYGFVGSHDLDGDGREDMVLGYGAVDYWRWILFVRRGACFAYIGSVDGYVVEPVAARHNGMRDLRVVSYPIMGRLEHYAFDGRTYVLTSAQPL